MYDKFSCKTMMFSSNSKWFERQIVSSFVSVVVFVVVVNVVVVVVK